jgi:hypothetical protein
MEGMGNVLQDIGARVQRRDELLAADQIMADVDTWALTALDDFSKRQDITSQQSLPEFQNALKQKKAEALSKFSGTADSRAALERQIDNQLTQYGKSAISTKIKVGHNLMTRSIEQQFDKTSNQVGTAPQILEDAISENVAYVNSRRDAMSADMYQAAIIKAQAAPIQAAVQSHIQNGAWDAAEAIMADERFSKLLAPEQARPLRIDAAVGRGKQEKEQREREVNRRAMSNFFGVEVSPEKAEENPDFMKMPAVQKMSLWRMMNPGQEMPDDVKMKALGLDKQVSESRIDRIVDMASNYDSLDNTDRMKLAALIQSEWRDVNGVDQFGNRTRFSTIPPQFARYVGAEPTVNPKTGNPVVTGSTSSGIAPLTDDSGNTYPPGTKLSIGGQPVTVNAEGRAIADDGSPVSGGPAPDDDVVDLYANYDKMTGVKAWVLRNAAKLPLNIGDTLNVNPAYGKAAMASEVLTNDIVRGFISMGEGKDTVANQYRQELKKIVSIEPKLIGSDREYLFKLQSISKELKQRRNEYQKIAETGATEDMRKSSIAAVATITKILSRIPIPEKVVDSDEEFAKLKPGETFITSSDPRPRRK